MDTIPATPRWLDAIGGPLVRWWLRLDVQGRRHVPVRGPVIVAPHHASHADTVAVGAACSRPLTFLGSVHLADQPLIGRLLTATGMLVVTRGTADRGALERCRQVLDRGAALVVYPEGGRTRDGRVYRPRSGVARIAAAAGCPVVPVGVAGTARAWPVGGWPRVWRRHRVRVTFGAPIDPPDDDPAARRRFADRLHDRLVDLSRAPRGEGLNTRTSA